MTLTLAEETKVHDLRQAPKFLQVLVTCISIYVSFFLCQSGSKVIQKENTP